MMDEHTAAIVLIGRLRLLAHDGSLAPDDALRRIRDEFYDYDHLVETDESASTQQG